MDKYTFKKFNLLCEEAKSELINEGLIDAIKNGFKGYSKRWTLNEEFNALLPIILKKIKSNWTNFHSAGKPRSIGIN